MNDNKELEKVLAHRKAANEYKKRNREKINEWIKNDRLKNPKKYLEREKRKRERAKEKRKNKTGEDVEKLLVDNGIVLKICNKHGPLSAKHITHDGKYANDRRCRLCNKESAAASKKANRERINAKTREDRKNNPEKYRKYERLKRKRNWQHNSIVESCRKMGIKKEKYEDMIKEQNDLCAICGKPETRKSRVPGRITRLAIDHCHVTGKVRALLCHSCNAGLGYFKDDILLLQKVIEYLEKHKMSG